MKNAQHCFSHCSLAENCKMKDMKTVKMGCRIAFCGGKLKDDKNEKDEKCETCVFKLFENIFVLKHFNKYVRKQFLEIFKNMF